MTVPSLWTRIRAFVALSLRESDIDYPREPVPRALGLLAIPMMLEMSMEAVFAIVDIAFVSFLGTDAVAAVGITEALVTILYAVAIGLGMGVTAMVSRRIGEGDRDAAASVTGQAIWIGVVMSILIGYIGIRFGADLLRLMGASDSVVETGAGFTTVLLGGSFSILFLFLLNAAFRGAGDANIALRSLWLANGINIVLDPCLIFGLGPFPEMGVTGAAVATTIGRGVGVAYQLYHLFDGRGRLACAWRHLVPVPSLLLRILRISIGGVGQFLIATSSWIVMMRIVAVHGSAAIAAYTIALRLVEFAFLPAWGLGNATATLVGQNLGAKQPDKAELSGWTAARFNAVFMTCLGLTLLLFARPIAGWFSDDPAVIDIATSCLRILGIGYPMYAVGMIMVQALNGAGDTLWPSILNLICFWMIQIPIAWYLAQQAGLGPNGVFVAIVVSECLLTVLSVIVFRRGHWKTVEA